MKNLPIVTITFTDDDWAQPHPLMKEAYLLAYQKLYGVAEANGIRLVRSSLSWMTKTGFKKGWTYTDGAWRRMGAYKPSLVWDKAPTFGTPKLKRQLHSQFPTVNAMKVQEIIDDKYLCYLAFRKHCMVTFLVHNKDQAKAVLSKIPGKKIVLKPVFGTGGKGVRVIEKTALVREHIDPFTLIQQFIDSSRGVPGSFVGKHDLRVAVIDGKIVYSYVRKPKGASLISNVARGGTMHYVPVNKLPARVVSIVKEIDAFFAPGGPRHYSVDFMIDPKGKPFIVELNSKPGILMIPELEKRTYENLVKFLKKHLA